jgi:hypothetical protein
MDRKRPATAALVAWMGRSSDGNDRRRQRSLPGWEGATTAALVAWMGRSSDVSTGAATARQGETKGDDSVFAWTAERHEGAASGVGRWGGLTRL